jgi:aspartate/methionine/tyrosine aminotransferase
MTATRGAAAAPAAHPYPMRTWVFQDAYGRYDIDLGDSHVACGTLSRLRVPADVELNYGVDRGTPELVGLVAARYGGDPAQVLVTHGAQEALYLLYATLLRPGDQVVAFRPGWPQAWDVPARLGCRVDVVDLAEDFAPDLPAVAAVAGPDLRAITVNTPANPTGRRARPDELAALAEIAERTGAYLLVDEEYVLDLSTSAALRGGRVVSVSSISKVYGFPGLRIGWMYGPAEVVSGCAEYKHLTSISNSVLCERLAVDVLSRGREFDREYRRLTEGGLRLLRDWAAGHPDRVRLVPPEGTPFAWLHLTDGQPSLPFARRVLRAGVLVMPAETFGAAAGLRITFAREPEQLAEGLRRISESLTDRESGDE